MLSLALSSQITYVFTSLFRCTSCAVWKTRVLISCAIVPLINLHNAETVLHSLLEQMTTCNQNALHTALLTIHRLVLERDEVLQRVQCTNRCTVFGVWLLENILMRYTLGLKWVLLPHWCTIQVKCIKCMPHVNFILIFFSTGLMSVQSQDVRILNWWQHYLQSLW